MSRTTDTDTSPFTVQISGESHIIITVNPGDFETRFFCLEGLGGACNREINEDYVRRLGRSWNTVKTSRVEVVLRPDGNYWIIDGQHRISAASRREEATRFKAACWPSVRALVDYLAHQRLSLAQYVEAEGASRTFKSGDKLHNSQLESPWVEPFKAVGLSPSYKGKRRGLTWNGVLNARINVDRSIAEQRFVDGRVLQPERLEMWRSCPDEVLERTADAYRLWSPFVRRAQKARALRFLTKPTLLTAWLLIYEVGTPSDLVPGVISRIEEATDDDLRALAFECSGGLREAVLHILKMANHKRTRHILSVFGQSGRGGQ